MVSVVCFLGQAFADPLVDEAAESQSLKHNSIHMSLTL